MVKELLKSKVGIIVPSCEPDYMFNMLIPSLKHISGIRDTAKFLINFNGPKWSYKSIDIALSKFKKNNFEVMSSYIPFMTKPAGLLLLRTLAAELDQTCDLYLFLDDDVMFVGGTNKYPFSSGQRYLHSIDYMTRFPRCGVINTKSFLGGSIQKLKIQNTYNDTYSTNRGLFLRNMKKHGFLLAPEETYKLVGGLEEMLVVMLRIEHGYFCAKQMNNPLLHFSGKLSDYDYDETNIHNLKVIYSNIGGYIKKRYDGWDFLKNEKKFPKILYDLYLKNGGLDINPTDPKYTIDYAEFENWDSSLIGRKVYE